MLDLQNINEIMSVLANKHDRVDNDTINYCIYKLTLYISKSTLDPLERILIENIIKIIQHIG